MLKSIGEYKAGTESAVAILIQEINQNRKHVDSVLNSISGEVRYNIQVWDSQVQSINMTTTRKSKE